MHTISRLANRNDTLEQETSSHNSHSNQSNRSINRKRCLKSTVQPRPASRRRKNPPSRIPGLHTVNQEIRAWQRDADPANFVLPLNVEREQCARCWLSPKSAPRDHSEAMEPGIERTRHRSHERVKRPQCWPQVRQQRCPGWGRRSGTPRTSDEIRAASAHPAGGRPADGFDDRRILRRHVAKANITAGAIAAGVAAEGEGRKHAYHGGTVRY